MSKDVVGILIDENLKEKNSAVDIFPSILRIE